ncbi:MAG TPA: hypothetical protein VJN18_33755 [Polyangiaceae bacterium]|nr:hypothetical protein [Polyangiaceae bacterium]
MRRLLLGLPLLFACQRAPEGVVKEAELGVFFGGQVQQLEQIPKQLDPARQRHGFRLTFAGPLSRDVPVTWELSLPAPSKGGPRPALVGQATAKAGQAVLDVPLAFRAQDPLGAWHARVTADGGVVIDRNFVVVAP